MPDKIDINCDIGELSYSNAPEQLEILNYISSCNIAAGFHAGDPNTILKTIREAYRKDVAIGVHPSYPDKANFGRVSMKMTDDELYASLAYQTSALSGMCTLEGTQLHHIKLHGALYHDAHSREEIAQVVIRFIQDWPEKLIVYGQPNSLLEEMARVKGIKWIAEGFIDRHYKADGHLVPRTEAKALMESQEAAIKQAIDLILNHEVKTVKQKVIPMNVRTLCIHGDHSGSLELAIQLQETLNNQNITISAPGI